MSMVSHAAGARFHALIGAPLLSFYDWYADLPVASPQVFGDQTDVPESGDWWDASYLILWGSGATKFADEWLSPAPGTDDALAMAMGHVILREFFADTVFDLLMAQYGVRREGLPGDWPSSYADASQPCTPAWQEAIRSAPDLPVMKS